MRANVQERAPKPSVPIQRWVSRASSTHLCPLLAKGFGATPTNLPKIDRINKNVIEAVSARQRQAKKRSLFMINEHFELAFNAAMATQIVFGRF